MGNLALASVFAVTAGCASTSPEKPFKNARAIVEERSGHRIAWAEAGDDEAAVRRRIHTLARKELDADTAVEIALLANPGLRATYEDLAIAQADLVQAGLLKNPSFDAGVAFPIAGDVTTGVSLGVTEDFLSIFTIAARKKIAARALEASTLRVADAVLELAHRVQVAFYELQAAEQLLTMDRVIVDAEAGARAIARAQHDAGNVDDLTLATEEAAYEELDTDRLRAETHVTKAREALVRLLGLWGADANVRVAAKLPELPPNEPPLGGLEALALAHRLDLQAAHAQADGIDHAVSLAKSTRFLGEPSVGAAYERAPERYSTVGPTASLEVPLFDQKQAVVARLEADLRAARAREETLGVDIRSEVREASADVVSARAIVLRYEKTLVPLREKAVALSQRQYDAMLLGVHPLLQSKQSEVRAYGGLVEALRDYWLARADLERATGGRLPEPTTVKTRGDR